jgi:superfamily II DNA or RNA helicase
LKYPPNFEFDNTIEADILHVSKLNEVHMHVISDNSIRQELSDYFSFQVPNAKFSPKYKNGMWDGRIKLYDVNKRTIYTGLHPYLNTFAKERDYRIVYSDDLDIQEEMSLIEASDYIKSLKTPFEARDYQIETFAHCVRKNRSLIVSPTASGKSFIIYTLLKWYGTKSLIIVPTTSLVMQMRDDFIKYGMNPDDIHIIMAGQEKTTNRDIVISTWQSIADKSKKFFSEYNIVIGDECHLFTAKSLVGIMTKLVDCKYRFGFTGTLDGTKCHKLVLEGLFGIARQLVTTKQLIDQKYLADFNIKCLVLKYTKQECKAISGMSWQQEMDFIVSHKKRNIFLKNLAISLDGNTLLLFQYIEKHGIILYNLIKEAAHDKRKIFFVSGKTAAEDREQIRAITEQERDAIIIGSTGTFSTGVNIVNLHNLILGSPSKSRIRNLQSIGRTLRRGDEKSKAILFDVADDFRNGKKVNHTLKHFAERVKIYAEQEFNYKLYNIKL